MSITIGDLVDRALGAYQALLAVAETVDDEWQYVTDLSVAWVERLDAVGLAERDRAATLETEAAMDRLIDEIGRIEDPHRAIDWLSTFPQVALLALGSSA